MILLVVKPIFNVCLRPLAETHPNLLYIEQKYGGHLGFYEGGLFCPNPVTWLDRNVVNIADGLAAFTANSKDKAASKMLLYGSGEEEDSEEEGLRMLEEMKLMDRASGEVGGGSPSFTSDSEGESVKPITVQQRRVGAAAAVYASTRPRFVCRRKGTNIATKVRAGGGGKLRI